MYILRNMMSDEDECIKECMKIWIFIFSCKMEHFKMTRTGKKVYYLYKNQLNYTVLGKTIILHSFGKFSYKHKQKKSNSIRPPSWLMVCLEVDSMFQRTTFVSFASEFLIYPG